jgi:MOSC domain-containing protein YiiM
MSERASVVSIHVAAAGEGSMVSVDAVRAVPGQGLEGDRYASGSGTFSNNTGGGRQVTLIESEALEALEHDYGINLDRGASRRNIVTRGVALNHLVGREFRIGEATLRGVRLCEPCGHLEKLTHPGVRKGLTHRGGLRTDIVSGGLIRAGDLIDVSS